MLLSGWGVARAGRVSAFTGSKESACYIGQPEIHFQVTRSTPASACPAALRIRHPRGGASPHLSTVYLQQPPFPPSLLYASRGLPPRLPSWADSPMNRYLQTKGLCHTFSLRSGPFTRLWGAIFFLIFLFGRQRDRVQAGEGQRERETQNRKQAPGSELSAQSPTRGSNQRSMGSWPGPKLDA